MVSATIINSVRMRAEKLIDTIWMNSSSKRINAPYIITPPETRNCTHQFSVYSIRLRSQQTNTLINAYQHPYEECLVAQATSFWQFFIQLRIGYCQVGTNIFVQNEWEHWKHRVNGCVGDHQETLIERNRRHIEYGRKDGLHRRNDESTVDDKLWECSRPLVRSTAMY